ncbi:TPA: glycosyltransferase family 39 protein, partial [archaeon]|nr:glycosyltransferase family 39 protein [Candidatus Naiadarchaeales archaeon SRR2090153.bin1042]
AEYSELAKNLLEGKGFVLNYIDQYYIKFDKIPHPLEWDYPMMGMIIAPFIYFFGKIPFAAKLPTIIIGTIFFPILTYYLGKEFFDRKIGFLAAISVLFYATIFELTISGQRDMAFAFFTLASIYFFYKGMKEDRPKYFYLMGVVLGISYLIKPTTLIIFPTLLLVYYLVKRKIDFGFVKGFLVAILVISPWLVRNYLIFGDPLFTANKYAHVLFRWLTDYEPLGYQIYWGAQKPSLSWLASQYPQPFHIVFLRKTIQDLGVQLENFLILNLTAFVGLLVTSRKKIEKPLLLLTIFIVIFSLFSYTLFVYYFKMYSYVMLLVLPYLIMLIIINFILAKENEKIRIFALLWTAFTLLHSLYVDPEKRFFLPLLPFLFIFAWIGIKHILELIPERYKKFKVEYAGKVIALILILFISFNFLQIYNYYHEEVNKKETRPISELINMATENDSVIMACNVIGLRYETERKFVEFPAASLEEIVVVMRTYNVRYITLDSCAKRILDNRLPSAISSVEFTQGYENVLYKVKLNEIGDAQKITTSFNAEPVAWLDNAGNKILSKNKKVMV